MCRLLSAAEIDEEEMVSDMVYNFVLPEVEREIMRKKIKVKEHEYLNTAHDELLNFSLINESEHQKEVEILDINLPTTSVFKLFFFFQITDFKKEKIY